MKDEAKEEKEKKGMHVRRTIPPMVCSVGGDETRLPLSATLQAEARASSSTLVRGCCVLF